MNPSQINSENINLIIAQNKKKQAMKNIMTGLLIVFAITMVVAALATITTITKEYISGPTLQPIPAELSNQADDLSVINPYPAETTLEEIKVPDETSAGSTDTLATSDPIARILAQEQRMEGDIASGDPDSEREKNLTAAESEPIKTAMVTQKQETEPFHEPVPVREIAPPMPIKKDAAAQVRTQQTVQSESVSRPGKIRAEPPLEVTGLPGKYPLASTRILVKEDLAAIPASELKIMRNEIFARHGYIFTTSSMREYFTGQPWYQPKHTAVTNLLSPVEVANVEFIQQIAQKKSK